MQQWYESLFENYAKRYDEETFTQGTPGECDFIEQEIKFHKSTRILDVGCGTGRHSIELARRGYKVVGVDLSESQLLRAEEKASEAKVDVIFLKADARKLPFSDQFNVAIMLCEGAFPLMETDEMNYQILQNVSKSLTSNAKLIFTTLNALFPLFNSLKKFYSSGANKGNAENRSNSFDLMTLRDHNTICLVDDNGSKKELVCNERYYMPSEITWLLKSAGFKTVSIFGAKLGAFSRNDRLTSEDFEMLVVAEKEGLGAGDQGPE
jgi:2-polyprenyl-3-methyl-5-hydroxy-6-metoxy-1,4-benzoquinol methylase